MELLEGTTNLDLDLVPLSIDIARPNTMSPTYRMSSMGDDPLLASPTIPKMVVCSTHNNAKAYLASPKPKAIKDKRVSVGSQMLNLALDANLLSIRIEEAQRNEKSKVYSKTQCNLPLWP